MPHPHSLKKLRETPPTISTRHRRRITLLVALAFFAGILFFFLKSTPPKIVNVYCWYQTLPPSVLADFTKETGIHVRLDFFDNNEIVETKLLAGNSGYDVVFPTIVPYVARQIKAGALQKIEKEKLSNFHEVDPLLINQVQAADPGLGYCIPYTWGTFGFSYNADMIKKRFPNAPTDSYAMLFDPEVVKRFQDCGVTLLEEATDIYPQVMNFMGINPLSDDKKDLHNVHDKLFQIRPFIRRFSTSRAMTELVAGETCLAQAWSGDIQVGIREAKALGRDIRYVIPKEGSALWIDVLVIPKNAPNSDHAHMFINYILRPEVAAKISEYCFLTTSVRGSKKYLPKEFLEEPCFNISEEVMKKLTLDKEQDINYERERNRLFTNFRMNRRV